MYFFKFFCLFSGGIIEFVKAVVENGAIAVIADINEDLNVRDLGFKKEDLERIDYVLMDITSKDSLKKAIEYLNKKYSKNRCTC